MLDFTFKTAEIKTTRDLLYYGSHQAVKSQRQIMLHSIMHPEYIKHLMITLERRKQFLNIAFFNDKVIISIDPIIVTVIYLRVARPAYKFLTLLFT